LDCSIHTLLVCLIAPFSFRILLSVTCNDIQFQLKGNSTSLVIVNPNMVETLRIVPIRPSPQNTPTKADSGSPERQLSETDGHSCLSYLVEKIQMSEEQDWGTWLMVCYTAKPGHFPVQNLGLFCPQNSYGGLLGGLSCGPTRQSYPCEAVIVCSVSAKTGALLSLVLYKLSV
jgi:hypothetical protein